MSGGMAWVRQQYGVPAKRGGRVLFQGAPGVITSVSGPHLMLRMDTGQVFRVHPTWEMEYLPAAPTEGETA